MVDTAYPQTGDTGKDAGKSRQAFRTISEVAKELDVPQHVLRFWETKFSYVKPMKRGGNRRYYRPEDVVLLQAIRYSLYSEGYTIKGVQKLLKDNGTKSFVEAFENGQSLGATSSSADEAAAVPATNEASSASIKDRAAPVDDQVLKVVLEELKALRKLVDAF